MQQRASPRNSSNMSENWLIPATHPPGVHAAVKRSEALTQATTWVDPEHTMLTEGSKMQQATVCESVHRKRPQRQIHGPSSTGKSTDCPHQANPRTVLKGKSTDRLIRQIHRPSSKANPRSVLKGKSTDRPQQANPRTDTKLVVARL